MITLIKNATIIDGGRRFAADIVIEDEIIADIIERGAYCRADEIVDASDCFVFPGIIDTHVHFREPGMTEKADIAHESRAAAAGGVTTFFDMPNTHPPTTTLEDLKDKFCRAERDSMVNYAFYFGATNDNVKTLKQLDVKKVCGVKVFMGSSTGNMLVDGNDSLSEIFETASIPIVTHCEDMAIVNRNAARIREMYGDDADVRFHEVIRSSEACYRSTARAICLAKATGAKLHVAHISTAQELALFKPGDEKITAEACLPHLIFCSEDYTTLRAKIKCNPSIKDISNRNALRKALTDGTITTVGTDHAPHLLVSKTGGALKAASGMPFIQYSLLSMLDLADKGLLPLERIAVLMSNNPARLFNVEKRGFVEKGYKADLTIVKKVDSWSVTANDILSKCKWSPLEGRSFSWRVQRTYCNGVCAFDSQTGINDKCRGKQISFDR